MDFYLFRGGDPSAILTRPLSGRFDLFQYLYLAISEPASDFNRVMSSLDIHFAVSEYADDKVAFLQAQASCDHSVLGRAPQVVKCFGACPGEYNLGLKMGRRDQVRETMTGTRQKALYWSTMNAGEPVALGWLSWSPELEHNDQLIN
jgi:hypothetical protein